jgi:hypothetical protein
VNDPRINAAMKAAEKVVGEPGTCSGMGKHRPDARRRGRRGAVASIESRDVRGINDLWDLGEWDYSYTSLK